MKKIDFDGKYLFKIAQQFREELADVKKPIVDVNWYPYDTLSNFVHLTEFFDSVPLNELVADGGSILDIGAADGELALMCEKLGYQAKVIDYAPTNHNNLQGIRTLSAALKSEIEIFDFNLDSYGTIDSILPNPVSLTFFLGIHYHLKNPFLVLDFLSPKTEYLMFSTRISRYTPRGYEMKGESLSYLLSASELNNDATNFWVFSEKAIFRLFERTGFEVVRSKCVGDIKSSVPNDMRHDERFFALLRSKNFNHQGKGL
jgi:hypothetical protein